LHEVIQINASYRKEWENTRIRGYYKKYLLHGTIQHLAATGDNTRNTNYKENAKIPDTVLVTNAKIIIDNPM
jgi:hypothetical protein